MQGGVLVFDCDLCVLNRGLRFVENRASETSTGNLGERENHTCWDEDCCPEKELASRLRFAFHEKDALLKNKESFPGQNLNAFL